MTRGSGDSDARRAYCRGLSSRTCNPTSRLRPRSSWQASKATEPPAEVVVAGEVAVAKLRARLFPIPVFLTIFRFRCRPQAAAWHARPQ